MVTILSAICRHVFVPASGRMSLVDELPGLSHLPLAPTPAGVALTYH
ncbi:MAG: hypothetical protein M3P18_16635 [Actinomycetota bacterium]|nr:hypothetical protein [Actinomycetota bacterium]